MKTQFVLFMILFILSIKQQAQTYEVKSATNYQFNPSALLSTKPAYDQVKEYSSYSTPSKTVSTELRIVGYYEDRYLSNSSWKRMSLKLLITTNSSGKDEINVVEYKEENSDFWQTLSYGNVSRTYGEMSKEYSYEVFILTKNVYFNL